MRKCIISILCTTPHAIATVATIFIIIFLNYVSHALDVFIYQSTYWGFIEHFNCSQYIYDLKGKFIFNTTRSYSQLLQYMYDLKGGFSFNTTRSLCPSVDAFYAVFTLLRPCLVFSSNLSNS